MSTFRHILIVALLSLYATHSFAATSLVTVRVALMEALALLDSSSSERYRQSLEAGLYYAIGENAKELNRCGYQIESSLAYFDNNDKISPQEEARKLEAIQSWVIFGPRRSDQFLSAVNGLQKTPLISPMAGANSVLALKPPFFTMYPGVDTFVQAAIDATTKEKYGTTYGAVVDATCSSCRDFESAFAKQSASRFQRKFSVDVAGQSPDLSLLMSELQKHPVDFLLLPNYSQLTGHIISKVQEKYPNIHYVGSDGWGDGQYGFLEAYGIHPNIRGLSVRGDRSPEEMARLFQVHSLDRTWQGSRLTPPYNAYAMLEFVRKLTSDLCTWKPKSREEFIQRELKLKSDHYRSKLGVSVFLLKDGNLRYSYSGEKTKP